MLLKSLRAYFYNIFYLTFLRDCYILVAARKVMIVFYEKLDDLMSPVDFPKDSHYILAGCRGLYFLYRDII